MIVSCYIFDALYTQKKKMIVIEVYVVAVAIDIVTSVGFFLSLSLFLFPQFSFFKSNSLYMYLTKCIVRFFFKNDCSCQSIKINYVKTKKNEIKFNIILFQISFIRRSHFVMFNKRKI